MTLAKSCTSKVVFKRRLFRKRCYSWERCVLYCNKESILTFRGWLRLSSLVFFDKLPSLTTLFIVIIHWKKRDIFVNRFINRLCFLLNSIFRRTHWMLCTYSFDNWKQRDNRSWWRWMNCLTNTIYLNKHRYFTSSLSLSLSAWSITVLKTITENIWTS